MVSPEVEGSAKEKTMVTGRTRRRIPKAKAQEYQHLALPC